MARDGMAQLIEDVRLNCELGMADYTVSGVTYWSDDEIQRMLDRNRKTVYRETLHKEGEYTTGTVQYLDYYWVGSNVEEYGTANPEIFHLEDAGGTAIGTADYTVNYEANHIRFGTDTLGSAYYLTYTTYDIDRTCAEVWRRKAAHVAQRADLKTDNHDLKASQLIDNYMKMAQVFERQAKPRVGRMVRSDLNV